MKVKVSKAESLNPSSIKKAAKSQADAVKLLEFKKIGLPDGYKPVEATVSAPTLEQVGMEDSYTAEQQSCERTPNPEM